MKNKSAIWISTYGSAFAQITLYNMLSNISETHEQIASRARLIADGAGIGFNKTKKSEADFFGG